MLELYHFKNSVCSHKVRMTLFEKNIEWKSHEVNLFASEQYDPKYLKLNPKGYVPTLVDGDVADEFLPLDLERIFELGGVGDFLPVLVEIQWLLDVGIPYRLGRGAERLHPAFPEAGDGGSVGAVDLHGEQIIAAHAHIPT